MNIGGTLSEADFPGPFEEEHHSKQEDSDTWRHGVVIASIADLYPSQFGEGAFFRDHLDRWSEGEIWPSWV
jgi:hypothetical protein